MQILTVSELIEELKKMPRDALVGHYYSNSYNLGDPNWIPLIERVELCEKKHYSGKEVVQVIGGIW